MKNILNKIYFHPLFIIILFVFILIGYFRLIIYFMLLITVHEMGHISISYLFKWKISKIIILPFGALTKYDEVINRPLKEEFFVAISGIVFQFVFYSLVKNNINYIYFKEINYFIILFNIIPIYPLDGSKILNVILNIFTSYKNSILITCIVSFICILILGIISFKANKILFVVLLFLLIGVNELYNKKDYLFNKFLLERYLNNYNFNKAIVVNKLSKMKKDYKHIFYIDNKYLTEKTILKKMFDIKSIL